MAVAAIASGVVVGQLFVAHAATPATLSCPPGDQILSMTSSVGTVTSTAPTSGPESLKRFVGRNYPRLSGDSFGYTAVSDTQVDFWYSEGSAVRAIATAQQFESKWYLTRFSACNSTLVAAGGGQ
jgi:hypothetical protein